MNPRILRIIGILCCVVFFLPGFHRQSNYDGASERTAESFSLGLAHSPWLSFERNKAAGEWVESEFRIRALSWSWLVLAVGAIALKLSTARSEGSAHGRAPSA